MALLVGLTALLVLLGGPLALGAAGALRRDDARIVALSTLLYALAFNTIFFIQELFLVLPKAWTPALTPTLYHNNHTWTGDNPLAELLQGTGALAILIVAVAILFWLTRAPPKGQALRVGLFWLAFSGFFQSLPQGVIGAIVPQNDVGRALTYLGLSMPAKAVVALIALFAIVAAGVALTRPLLQLARHQTELEAANSRTRFAFLVAVLPAILGTLIVFFFRTPGSFDQVYVVPIAVAIIGASWLLAGAWRTHATATGATISNAALLTVLALLVAQGLVFHLVLRPGITF